MIFSSKFLMRNQEEQIDLFILYLFPANRNKKYLLLISCHFSLYPLFFSLFNDYRMKKVRKNPVCKANCQIRIKEFLISQRSDLIQIWISKSFPIMFDLDFGYLNYNQIHHIRDFQIYLKQKQIFDPTIYKASG